MVMMMMMVMMTTTMNSFSMNRSCFLNKHFPLPCEVPLMWQLLPTPQPYSVLLPAYSRH
jgi:hypothetical protein